MSTLGSGVLRFPAMLELPPPPPRTLLFALAAFLIAVSSASVAAQDKLDAEAFQNAQLFSNKAFAHWTPKDGGGAFCEKAPNSYFMGLSDESNLGLVEFHVTEGPVMVGSKEIGPIALNKVGDLKSGLSPAELDNGVRWKGGVLLYYDKSREQYWSKGVWHNPGPWGVNHSRKEDSPLDGSNLIAALENINGRWYAVDLRATGRLRSFADTDPTPLGYINSFSLRSLLESFGTTVGGWKRIKQLLVDIDQPTCKEIDTPGRRNRPEPLKALKNREFTGTMADFIAAFPGLLKQATDALEIDYRDYQKERDFIVTTAQKCGQITTAMMSDVEQLGEGYAACHGSTTVTSQLNATDKERDLGIALDVRPFWNRNSPASAGYAMYVTFVRPSDGGIPPHFRDNLIAYARIYSSAASSAAVLKAMQRGEALQQLNRKLTGSLDEFETALPGAVRNAATAMSLNPDVYSKEIELIGQTVRKCVNIPPEVIARLPKKEYARGHYYPPNVRDLPSEYDLCKPDLMRDVSSQVRSYDKGNERGLLLAFSSLSPNGTWGDASGFKALIYFSTLSSETATPDYYFGSFGILDAEIHSDWTAPTVPASVSHRDSANPLLPSSDPNVYIRLTPTNPSATRQAEIVAPGAGLINYNLFTVDTRDFPNGGALTIDISLSADSRTAGSFDLYPSNVPIPKQGRPVGTLVGKYDVPIGTSTRLQYRFSSGQIFALGLEGNWASIKGTPGMVKFRVTVHP